MRDSNAPVITLDGASGTGKGTVSQILAKKIGWKFLDSGALYRVLALAIEKHGFALSEHALDEQAIEKLAEYLDVQFLAQSEASTQIILEGEEVSKLIRTEKIGNAASIIAALPKVRTALLSRQRAFREAPGLIADGRDMGTVVFPQAEFKFFLTSSLEERALRRYQQLKSLNTNDTLNSILAELQQRDQRDQNRSIAPLKPAADAVCISTDGLTAIQVVEQILMEINEKKAFSAGLIPHNKLEACPVE